MFDTMIWDVAGNSTSMIVIQNIGEVEASVRVTLSFDEGRGSYKVPLFGNSRWSHSNRERESGSCRGTAG